MKRELMIIGLLAIGTGSHAAGTADAERNATQKSADRPGQTAMQRGDANSSTTAASRYPDAVRFDTYRVETSPYALRASDLIGRDIHNAQGEEIGEVDDLLVGRGSKDIRAVLEVGGVMGIGAKRVTIPYSDLMVSRDGEYVFVDATEEQLEARPAFNYNEGERAAMLTHVTTYQTVDAERDSNTPQSAAAAQAGNDSTVRQIRQSMKSDDALSDAAKNVEVVKDGDEIVLRGQVRSEDMRDRVLNLAKVHAGSASVTDEIVVAEN
jgi:osmotically-inducible protein OsmY